MPNFPFPAAPTDLEPQWPPTPQTPERKLQPRAPQRLDRAGRAAEVERQAGNVPVIGGVLKPTYQFLNALGSPDTLAGVVTGPVNGISKLTNALGDLIQRKPVDVSDAWKISDKATRRFNPIRLWEGQQVTPADEAGLAIGEGIGAEIAGAVTAGAVLKGVQAIGAVKAAADALRRTQQVKRLAVAAKVSKPVRAGLTVGKNVAEATASTAAAALFLDQEDGNLANLGDALGLKLPGRVETGENYLLSTLKSVGVEGLAAPLALMGAGALIPPIRRGLAEGGSAWLDELANAELAPYVPGNLPTALPPAAAADLVDTGNRSLPAFGQSSANYGELFQQMEAPPAQYGYDSAIGRALQEQTQIRQVVEQRQRLQGMGLVQQGEGGQLELSLGGVVDPEIRLQIRDLQVQRGRVIKAAMQGGNPLSIDPAAKPDSFAADMRMQPGSFEADMIEALGKIDQQINDLIQQGKSSDFMPTERPLQPELDLVDPRPELDTYLANLDELSDAELRQIHSRVYQQQNAERTAQELTATQAQLEELNQRLVDIQTRAEAGEITPTGAKRMTSKAQKEIEAVQQQLRAIEGRQRVPESLVGDQLQLRIEQQGQLDLNPPVQLPPFEAITRTASEYGYRSPEEYRSALQGWNRDQLRRLAMPDSSPEVAALVKANTGRRVWSAKKSDIIDALVELSKRRGRYLPPEAEQLAMELKANQFGDAAPLFDRPADLAVPGMGRVLDADGNEVPVPMTDYSGRGMDAETRERLKAEILQRAIDNGEVQPPFSPLPERPRTSFKQSSMVDQLFADPTGQLPLMFATDELPTYKAGGKAADALIEELRLRFEYKALDDAAQQAQRDAFLAEKGWDTMTWEEKKKLGILSEGFYSLDPYSERFQAPTPAARSDLGMEPVAPRKPNQYRLTFDEKGNSQIAEQPKPQAKPTPEEVKVQNQAAAAAKRELKNQAKSQTTALDKQEAAIRKRLDELTRQSKGASC